MAQQDRLTSVVLAQQKLKALEYKLIEEGLQSTDPGEIMKAQVAMQAVENREGSDRKSFLLDPNDFYSAFGYKDRRTSMSYGLLRNMARTPIINAIVRTRINQVASFSEPQENRHSLGFVIERKPTFFAEDSGKQKPLNKQELKEIEFMTEFIDNCGQNNSFEGDDFDAFLRKIVRDSLVYDQMTFEIVPDSKGYPYEFSAVDASTIRIAESFDDEEYRRMLNEGNYSSAIKGGKIKGYYPNYVQIWQNNITAEFYPWEMCFGVRNPTTNVLNNGYGISELEELVSTVTSLLWGEEYNRRFFKQGSMPKAMFRVNGNVNETRLREFRQFWQSTMQGVWNSWRVPIIQSDNIEYIDLQKTNQEMEFSKWIEFLIKVSCAIYTIDPAEVNFPLSGGSDQQSLFEGSNEQRLKHSRDKGLAPILRFVQKRINKFLVSQFFDGKYRFRFVGIDALTPKEEQEMDIAALSNYEMLDEVRTRRGLPALGEEAGGNLILNPTYMQYINQKSMMDQQQQGGDQQDMFDGMMGGGQQPGAEGQQDGEENPFAKAINSYLEKLNA